MTTTTTQTVTEDLRRWIIAQAEAGCRPEDIVAAMTKSGWDEEVALDALEATLRDRLDQVARERASIPPAVPVPEPSIAGGHSVLWAGDRDVKILFTMKVPRVIVFGGLLSDEECDTLVELARPKLVRSETVVNATGGSEVNEARTSSGMFFDRGATPFIAALEKRIATLVNWPVDNGEGIQILHYGPGAEYRPHHDYFDPVHPGTATILQRGGQRVGTVVVYLNTPKAGGGTTFPDVGLEVAAIKGNAVFFSYDRAHVVTKTLHGGAPVIEGEKWVATKWMRERVFA
jgi:prolyl 4-hydroxylase